MLTRRRFVLPTRTGRNRIQSYTGHSGGEMRGPGMRGAAVSADQGQCEPHSIGEPQFRNFGRFFNLLLLQREGPAKNAGIQYSNIL